MPTKYTYTQVQDIFTQNKCILVSQKYENQLRKLEYIASCGHTHNIILHRRARAECVRTLRWCT